MRKSLRGQQLGSVLRVVIYLRVSENRDEQQSSANQEREARQYAEQKGWQVVRVCQDIGKSGYNPKTKRPGFDAAISMVETRQAEVFLVWKVSRFIRRIREFHMFLDRLVKAGGKFDSVTDDVDYTTASGELLLAMVAGFAQMESAAKADFSQSWNEGRTLNGACPQGPRPFGYDRIAREEAKRDSKGNLVTLVVNAKEAAIIEYAAGALLEGKSIGTIVRALKDERGTGNGPISQQALKAILKNPTTAGLRAMEDAEGNTQYIQGCWEPILARDTWEAVRNVYNDPDRLRCYTGNGVRHLVSGILSCGKCNNRIGIRRWRQSHRYTCFHCFNSASKPVIEEAVKARLLSLVDQTAWKALKEQGRGYDPAVIKEIEDEQQALWSMWKAKKIKLAMFEEGNEELAQRLAQATGTEPLDLPDVENLAEGWDNMNVLDQRRVLNVVFKEMTLLPANGKQFTMERLHLDRAI